MHNHLLRLRQFCQYSRTLKGNTERGVKTLSYEVGHFFRHVDVPEIADITQTHLENYLFECQAKHGWAAKTVRNRLISMRVFLDWCVHQELIVANPARNIPLPKLPKRLPKSLCKQDALALLDWTQSYRYEFASERSRAVAIIAMFMFSGLRLSELYNLKRTDVNLEQRTLFVRSGKGDKDRLVIINDELALHLSAYLQERDRQRKHCPYFFASIQSDKPIDVSVVPRLVKKLRNSCGIYFTAHMLRHTFATLMLEGGADLVAIKEMMGHSDINTTMIYLSVSTGHLREAINKHALSAPNRVTADRFWPSSV